MSQGHQVAAWACLITCLIACIPCLSIATGWQRHLCTQEVYHRATMWQCGVDCLYACHVPVSLHSGLGITCLYLWCVQGCHTVAWVPLFANLPCPRDITRWTGLPIHMTAMFLGHHTAACACLFMHLPYLSAAPWWPGECLFTYLPRHNTTVWQPGHTCLQISCVPDLSFGSLGTPVCTLTVSQGCHLVASEC